MWQPGTWHIGARTRILLFSPLPLVPPPLLPSPCPPPCPLPSPLLGSRRAPPSCSPPNTHTQKPTSVTSFFHVPAMTPGWVSTTFRSKSTMSSGLQPSSSASRLSRRGWCRCSLEALAGLSFSSACDGSRECGCSGSLAQAASMAQEGRAGLRGLVAHPRERPGSGLRETAGPRAVLSGPMTANPTAQGQAPKVQRAASLPHNTLMAMRGVHSVCLLGLNPVEPMSRWRWMASMGIRSTGRCRDTCPSTRTGGGGEEGRGSDDWIADTVGRAKTGPAVHLVKARNRDAGQMGILSVALRPTLPKLWKVPFLEPVPQVRRGPAPFPSLPSSCTAPAGAPTRHLS